jgi:integrase
MGQNIKPKEKTVEKNIYTRTNGGSFRVKLYSNGTRINAPFDTLAEAQSYLYMLRANKTHDRLEQEIKTERVEKLRNKNFTLSDALDKFAKEIPDDMPSGKDEKYRIGKLKRQPIAKLNFYNINENDVLDAVAIIGGSTESQRHYALLIGKIYKRAKRWRITVANPISGMDLPEKNPPRERRLTPAEYELIKKNSSEELLLIIDFAIETACRKSEILKATTNNLKTSECSLLLPKTKNGFQRVVPLSTKAISICNQVKSDTRATIFNMTAKQLRTEFEKLIKVCNISDLHFHDLRHEAVSRFFEKGIDGIVISMISGHKDLEMLKRYTHLKPYDIAQKLG